MANTEREKIHHRMEYYFTQYGWTPEQQELFRKFVEERCANHSNLSTILRYLAALNHVAESTCDDLRHKLGGFYE